MITISIDLNVLWLSCSFGENEVKRLKVKVTTRPNMVEKGIRVRIDLLPGSI